MNATQSEPCMNHIEPCATGALTTREATCGKNSSLAARLKTKIQAFRSRFAQPGRRLHNPVEARAYKRQVELHQARVPYRLYY